VHRRPGRSAGLRHPTHEEKIAHYQSQPLGNHPRQEFAERRDHGVVKGSPVLAEQVGKPEIDKLSPHCMRNFGDDFRGFLFGITVWRTGPRLCRVIVDDRERRV